MNAPRPLMSLEEALAQLLAAGTREQIRQTETVSSFEALGRVLAEDVASALDVPPADNSSMDGYALRLADVPAAGAVLRVGQRIPAGHVGRALEPGTAARIFTGAQVPPGADAIVMQELSTALDDGQVRIDTLPLPGQWIRRRGEDIRDGSTVLTRGTRLTPQALGLAAAVGRASLAVLRRPRVALFSTGDELVMPGQPLKPGAIYNSNRYTLRGLLQAAGCEVQDLGIVPDRLDATRAALRAAAGHNDLIVTSGGVSVGEEDHLRPAMAAEGRVDLWQLSMKPGKPLAFGALPRQAATAGAGTGEAAVSAGEALFIGLPGNPVSSWVTGLLAVLPLLRALQGMPATQPRALSVRADFDWPRPDKRREFLRARFNAEGGLELFANQSSGVLTSAHWADGLIDNAGGQAIVRGDAVRFLPLADLTSA
ncbi:MAG: molybdopterin molybdotransferase MoeA [Rubrivivax sp.]|nr:molybdopterin molybdotransferase MoeA [Rubrivivax sp.]